jgi:hypothetical protein
MNRLTSNPSGYEPAFHPDKRGGDALPRFQTPLITNPRSTPASGVGTHRLAANPSGDEPTLHPGERAWGRIASLETGYEPAFHPGERGGDASPRCKPLWFRTRVPPRRAGWGRITSLQTPLVTNPRSTPASGVGTTTLVPRRGPTRLLQKRRQPHDISRAAGGVLPSSPILLSEPGGARLDEITPNQAGEGRIDEQAVRH